MLKKIFPSKKAMVNLTVLSRAPVGRKSAMIRDNIRVKLIYSGTICLIEKTPFLYRDLEVLGQKIAASCFVLQHFNIKDITYTFLHLCKYFMSKKVFIHFI